MFESVKDKLEGVCLFCATAFGAKDAVKECKVHLIDEKDQHIDVKKTCLKWISNNEFLGHEIL